MADAIQQNELNVVCRSCDFTQANPERWSDDAANYDDAPAPSLSMDERGRPYSDNNRLIVVEDYICHYHRAAVKLQRNVALGSIATGNFQ